MFNYMLTICQIRNTEILWVLCATLGMKRKWCNPAPNRLHFCSQWLSITGGHKEPNL